VLSGGVSSFETGAEAPPQDEGFEGANIEPASRERVPQPGQGFALSEGSLILYDGSVSGS
jgi:hypothetical protein